MLERIEKLIEGGRYFEAHIIAKDYCAENPDDLRALQLCGLAMSKSGAREAAIDFLEPVLDKNENDVETAGILGGVYKEQFKKTAESDYARKSHETYLTNFEKTRSYYTGINAATMSQILGRGIAARQVARQVADIASKDEDFWAIATLGEAYLLLKEPIKAYKTYKEAARLGAGQFGKMGSVYAQLLILKHYIVVPERVISLFAPPNIAIFSGHMIDNNRPEPRFPASIESEVKEALKAELVKHNIRIGFSSLACGSDILFVESLLELDGEVNLFLPFRREDFLETSVRFAGQEWVDRFKKIEQEQEITYITKSPYEGNDQFFKFLGQVITGSAIMRASLFHSQPFLVTVASERDTERRAGGANFVRSTWPYESKLLNINPDKYLDFEEEINAQEHLPPVTYTSPIKNKIIQFFVFATVLNANEKDEATVMGVRNQISDEFIEFPGQRRSGIDENDIFALYSRPHYAMDFALRLLDWTNRAGLQVRIALEAILMTKGEDPLPVIESTSNLKTLAFSDACYATMQFAAALSAEQPARYDFHHVGVIQTGKTDEGQEIYKIDQKIETALG